jgi:ABC-type multidrug transport system ATPase subunit
MTKIETQKQKIEFAKRKEIILLNSQDWIKHKDYPKINPLYEEALELEKRGETKESIETYEKIIDINEYYIKAWEGIERNYNALGESEKKYSALKKIRSITEFIDFAKNAAQKINLQQCNLQNLDFFDNLFWTFQPQINILLGKNGYGKTYLLRLLISLLQKDEDISSEFFKESKSKSFVRCNLERNNDAKVIHRIKTVFEESIGKMPVLAIPDMRLVDKSRTRIEKTILDTPIRASGAYHFLYEKPFEEVIQNFLYALCISMDKDKPFEQPLFQLLHKIVRKLADKEFKFDEIVAIGEKFEINVITEGNPEKPLPLQKASQGTLSVLSIFGLIYYFLTSVFPDTPEEELLKKPAIVFIDEIDAHLHPSWQQKIIGLLRENFPNVQFIVTAHSPLVVAGCYENEVAVLRKGKGGFTIEQFERDFIGYEAKELYQIIFDIEEKDETYLQYTALGLFKKGIESDISKLESKYLFSWDNVPGNDNEILLKSLKDDIDIDWAENAEIRKSDDGKTLRISKSENSAEILIDEKKEKATLKISGGRTHNLKVKKENSKLNIYESKTKVEKLSEDEKRKLHKLYKDLNYIGQTRKKYDERTQPSNLLIQNRRLKAEIEKLKRELIKNGVKYDRG